MLVISSVSRMIKTIDPESRELRDSNFPHDMHVCIESDGCNKYNSVASKCIKLAHSQLTLSRSPIIARRNSILIEVETYFMDKLLVPLPLLKVLLKFT